MGESFRNVNQIVRLAGTDSLTISPDLLDQPEQAEEVVDRQLDPEKARTSAGERLRLIEKIFRWMHNEYPMATEKLTGGIHRFNAAASRSQVMRHRRDLQTPGKSLRGTSDDNKR